MRTFLTSKRFLSPSELAAALAAFAFAGGASAISTSAMFVRCVEMVGCAGDRWELLVVADDRSPLSSGA
jgi:hypothetical protein